MRGSAYKGEGWRALHCSAKTEIASDMQKDELCALVREGLRGLVRSLPARIRGEAEAQGCVERAMGKVQGDLGGFSARRRVCAGEPTMRDVKAVKARFEDQVISEIDKESGELAVLCTVTQYHVMESAFERDLARYEVVQLSEETIMQKCIDKCIAEDWTELGQLYGVVQRKGKTVPDSCMVPVGYGTIKGKSWKLQIVKGRPISGHTRHVMKRISNRNARAYHTMLSSINTERITRMYTTQEYKHRIVEDQVRIQKELVRLTGDAGARPSYIRDV